MNEESFLEIFLMQYSCCSNSIFLPFGHSYIELLFSLFLGKKQNRMNVTFSHKIFLVSVEIEFSCLFCDRFLDVTLVKISLSYKKSSLKICRKSFNYNLQHSKIINIQSSKKNLKLSHVLR